MGGWLLLSSKSRAEWRSLPTAAFISGLKVPSMCLATNSDLPAQLTWLLVSHHLTLIPVNPSCNISRVNRCLCVCGGGVHTSYMEGPWSRVSPIMNNWGALPIVWQIVWHSHSSWAIAISYLWSVSPIALNLCYVFVHLSCVRTFVMF